MSLVVEDGTGKTDAQSYVSLADANAYHTTRGNTAWTGTDAEKEAALIRATEFLDGRLFCRWPGLKYSTTQALEWPRIDALDSDGEDISESVPAGLVKATCEAALVEIASPRGLGASPNENGTLLAETEGGQSKTYAPGVLPSVPPEAMRPLYRLLRPAGIMKVVRA